jgi:hypothetical protein
MPNLNDIIWAAITFVKYNYNDSYLRILGRENFLKTLRESPQDIAVNEVRRFLVQFLNDWGCRLRNYDEVTASKLKDCIINVHSDFLFFQNYSILDFDFEDPGNAQKIINLFNEFWTFSGGSQIASNFGSTATSKTLHIVNPNLFTMWDSEIRYQYGFIMESGSDYIKFLKEIRKISENLVNETQERYETASPALFLSRRLSINPPLSLVKFIDAYNWLTYTKKLSRPTDWITPF